MKQKDDYFKKKPLRWVYILFGCLSTACTPEGPETEPILVAEPVVVVNPTQIAPLSAKLSFETRESVTAEVRVVGRNGPESDVVIPVAAATTFDIPVVGLYPGYLNQLELTLYNQANQVVAERSMEAQTFSLTQDMPVVKVLTRDLNRQVPGYNLVNYFGFETTFRPQRPFMFDAFGDIRWLLHTESHPILGELFYDNGLQRLANGNLFFGDGSTGAIYEINMLGEVLNSWSLQGYGFHHHVIEKPNGNFLVTVNAPNFPTIEDHIIEIDRQTGQILRIWDLNQSLDNQRRVWTSNVPDPAFDWFHANALLYDPKDQGIIVSGRTQGVVKLTPDNEVQWILAPHRGWDTAGNGAFLPPFLLQPLDASGLPINAPEVLDGRVNHPDFEWAWYQHAPIFLPNGHLMLFDNGDMRNYSGSERYSRAVEYKIDEENRTIQQVWSYGKERGEETYSRIVSKVSYHPAENHVLFTPGAASQGLVPVGRIVEVAYPSGEVIFEATVTPPQTVANISFHNVQRMPLMP